MTQAGAVVRSIGGTSCGESSTLRAGKRFDIQGLRAICMLQVLGYHAWTIGSPIGVDSFIMISAFLMTGSFVRRAETGRTPWFVERWLNTFKRLLPPLVITVLATVALALLVLPRTRWMEIMMQGTASVTYWQNWRLAAVSADYFAHDHSGASPLQHLWSMSMQGQVFLLWPLVMTLCAWAASRMGRGPRRLTVVTFSAISLVSLCWLLFAAPDDGSIYFDTRARVWEFALGSAIAAAAPWISPRGPLARALSWLGLVVLVVYCVVPIGDYPGLMAAVPMLAVSTILLAAEDDGPGSVRRVLSWRPLVWLGDRSYAVYLVHWPLFTLYLAARDVPRLGVSEGVVLMVVSVVLASVMTTYVDRPAQVRPRTGPVLRKKAVMVSVSLIIGLTPLGIGHMVLAHQRAEELADLVQIDADEHPGATAITSSLAPSYIEPPVPGPLARDHQWYSWPYGSCSPEQDRGVQGNASRCAYSEGDTRSSVSIVVVGDSHAQQNIVPVVHVLAAQHGAEVTTYLKGGCTFGVPEAFDGGECRQRNRYVMEWIEREQPDIVMLQTTQAAAGSADETLRPGVVDIVECLTDQGVTVIGFRDNLRAMTDLYECSDERPSDQLMGGCLLLQNDFLATTDPAIVLADTEGFVSIDATDLYCVDGICPTILGNVYVYMDSNHLTSAYSRTMAEELANRVAAATGM